MIERSRVVLQCAIDALHERGRRMRSHFRDDAAIGGRHPRQRRDRGAVAFGQQHGRGRCGERQIAERQAVPSRVRRPSPTRASVSWKIALICASASRAFASVSCSSRGQEPSQQRIGHPDGGRLACRNAARERLHQDVRMRQQVIIGEQRRLVGERAVKRAQSASTVARRSASAGSNARSGGCTASNRSTIARGPASRRPFP